MKTKLLKLSPDVLRKIGKDYSILHNSPEVIATKLAEYFKAYGFRYSDVASRYGIKNK